MRCITLETLEDHIAVVTFHRPPINAIDLAANIEIAETFEELSRNDQIRCVVFRSIGKGFISGSDTGDFSAFDEEILKANEDADIRSVLAIESCRVPVICQVQGYVMGLGTCLAAASDFIVAAENTYFSQPEVRLCVVGGTGALRQLVPEKFMRYMVYTGKKIGVETIAKFGSIHMVVPLEDAFGTALDLGREIARNSSKAVYSVKAAIHDLIRRDSEEEYRIDCQQTHIMLRDPMRDEILTNYNQKIKK